jgi:hypothetical protein
VTVREGAVTNSKKSQQAISVGTGLCLINKSDKVLDEVVMRGSCEGIPDVARDLERTCRVGPILCQKSIRPGWKKSFLRIGTGLARKSNDNVKNSAPVAACREVVKFRLSSIPFLAA